MPTLQDCGNSSVGRASASQAEGRGFESRFPLHFAEDHEVIMPLKKDFLLSVGLLILVFFVGGCASRTAKLNACTAIASVVGGSIGAAIGSRSDDNDGSSHEAAVGGAGGVIVGGFFGRALCDRLLDTPPARPERVTIARPAIVQSEGVAEPPDPCAGKIVLRGVLFDFDRDAIRPDATVILDEAVRQLSICKEGIVEVKGHTDFTGPEEYNQILSEKRAEAVKAYLVAEGISIERFRVTGYGESQPIAKNTNKEGRALNRRVELDLRQ